MKVGRVIFPSFLTFPSLWMDIHSLNTMGWGMLYDTWWGSLEGKNGHFSLSFLLPGSIGSALFLQALICKGRLPCGKACGDSALLVLGWPNLGFGTENLCSSDILYNISFINNKSNVWPPATLFICHKVEKECNFGVISNPSSILCSTSLSS